METEPLPPRPTPARTETNQNNVDPMQNFFGPPFGFHHRANYRGANISFSAGMGMPGLFPFQMNLARGRPLTAEEQQQAQFSHVFLIIAFIILASSVILS